MYEYKDWKASYHLNGFKRHIARLSVQGGWS